MTEEKQEEKKPLIGDFTPKRKFLNFISASNRAKVRYIRDIAFLKGEKLSGVLEGIVFKITICDEGTINFEEVDTNVTDKAQLQRLLDDIDSMSVNGYAQKFVISELEFSDVNGDRCYLEVEHQKPIDKLSSLFDMFDKEKKEVEEKASMLSDRGMSVLDSLFGNTDSDSNIIETERDAEVFFDAIENPAEPNDNLKLDASSYLEEQFRKMNEDKIKELKERVSKKLEDVVKYNRDKSLVETKLEKSKEELSILETRLESMTPGDEPNGYAFYVSEEQKNETGLDESTRNIVDKIADLMKLKKDVLFDYLTGGYYIIKIANKDNFESEDDIESDILSKVASIDPLVNVSITGKGEFEYRGELTWHQIVQKMIRNGFEQVPEFDEFCNSNSYESHEEEKEDNFTGIDLGQSTGVGSGHPDDFESEFDKDEEFMFAIYEDLSASNQLGEPQAMIQICPKSYFLKEGYAYDQHTEHEIKLRYPYLRTLGHQLEELCESSYAINDGTTDLNKMMHLNTRDTIEELCKAGLKMNKDFQNFISSKDLQMVENTMNSLGYSNLVE
jgi:hypothetical protein